MKFPMSGHQASVIFANILSEYEMTEIIHFPEVYFVGNSQI